MPAAQAPSKSKRTARKPSPSHSPVTRPYKWRRTIVGGVPKYTIVGRELNKPHKYKDDVFDGKRCRAIQNETVRRLPVGKLVIGHEHGKEGPRVGAVVNYRTHPTKHDWTVGDLDGIEPAAFLDIATGRIDHTSVEFEWPGCKAIEAVSLLGRSRQFFDDFPPLRVELTEAQWEQLKADAREWPLQWRSRAPRPDTGAGAMPNEHEDRDDIFDDDLDETHDEDDDGREDGDRMSITIGNDDDANREEGGAMNQMDFDTQLANSDIVKELFAKIDAISDRMGLGGNHAVTEDEAVEMGGGDADEGGDEEYVDLDDEEFTEDEDEEEAERSDDEDEDDMADRGKGNKGGRRRESTDNELRARVIKLERQRVRDKYETKLDAMRAAGHVCGRKQAKAILDATMAARGKGRAEMFDSLTAGLPKAPINDDDTEAQKPEQKQSADAAVRSAISEAPRRVQEAFKRNRRRYAAEAEEMGMTLAEYIPTLTESTV